MAKFSGFVLSAILVVLCLWLSVFSFPNVISPDDLNFVPSRLSETINERDDATRVVNASETSVSLDAAIDEKTYSYVESIPGLDEKTEEESSQSSPLTSGSEPVMTAVGLSNTIEPQTPTKDVATKDARKANGRAQGGKYVSIPSAEVDAFRVPAGSPYADRVIRTTRAVVPQIDPTY